MPEIYDRLWKLDTDRFSVSLPDGNGGWVDPDADLKLEEQHDPSGRADSAPLALFRHVNKEKLETGAYGAFKTLLDNYVVREGEEETHSVQEVEEIDRFIQLSLFKTDGTPKDVTLEAYRYIVDELGFASARHDDLKFSTQTFAQHPSYDLTDLEQFARTVRGIWFGIYTNRYGGNIVQYSSGFEHVFVGEVKGDNVGGYHFWPKYYWDELNGDADYLGAFYHPKRKFHHIPSNRIGMLNPDVATLRFRWEIDGQEYTKDKGGFFVGVSPEFLLLIGVVGVFENILHDREPRPHWFDREDMRSAIINGRSYKIATHRETPAKTRPNSGFHLRSYWPMYVFTASSRDERYSGEQPVERPQPGHSGTTIAAREAEISVGPVLLSELLPNPRTEGDSDEWVRFQNNTNTLWTGEGWKLKIGNEVSSLDGTVEIPAGFDGSLEVRKLNPPLALSNRGGTVTLLDPTGNVACQVSYPKVPALFEDVIFRFVPAG